MSRQIQSQAQDHDEPRPARPGRAREPERRLDRALKAGYSFLIDAMSLADMVKVEIRLYGEYVTIVPGKMPALAVLDRAIDRALVMSALVPVSDQPPEDVFKSGVTI